MIKVCAMVHSKKVPEAVNLQAVQAALRMLQMNTTQEGVENYFGNELSLLAKMAGFQTNISPPFIDKASPFAKQTEVIMPKYKSKKRRANGDGSYSVLQTGKSDIKLSRWMNRKICSTLTKMTG